MHPAAFFAGIGSGAALGGLMGYFTRPTFLGVDVPLGILGSTAPADAELRSELASHLAMAVGAGAVAAAILLFALTFVSRRQA